MFEYNCKCVHLRRVNTPTYFYFLILYSVMCGFKGLVDAHEQIVISAYCTSSDSWLI